MFKFIIMKYALFVGMLVCQISLIIGFTIGVSHATSLPQFRHVPLHITASYKKICIDCS